jgi:acyl-CoA thioesterase I
MRSLSRGALGAVFAVILLVPGAASAGAAPTGAKLNCAASSALTALGAALSRTGRLLEDRKSATILAMGSSSTQGIGASSPTMSYPSRLEQDLREAFPTVAIKVVNHGRSGQDVGEESVRLNHDVVAEHPDLVIWQVGTNSLLRREDLGVEEQRLAQGIEQMKRQGIDVVLMDLQYAPRVLARQSWSDMERLIAGIARRERVGYFRRFEIMREWDQTGQLGPEALIGPDGLHMTDVSYACLASRLATSLVDQWQAESKLAQSSHRGPAALAGSQQPIVGAPR